MLKSRFIVATGALLAPLACAPVGGPVKGAADTHCALPDGGLNLTVVNPASCSSDGGTAAGTTEYGDPRDNTTAYDDDCKYKVSYDVTPVKESTDVTFTVKLTSPEDAMPVAGANPYVEAFIGTHPARGKVSSAEPTPGTYVIGPIQFDQKGTWTVRFHFFGTCSDVLPDSPHGHAAFNLSVP